MEGCHRSEDGPTREKGNGQASLPYRLTELVEESRSLLSYCILLYTAACCVSAAGCVWSLEHKLRTTMYCRTAGSREPRRTVNSG